jgi:flagellar biosynthesis protein FliR
MVTISSELLQTWVVSLLWPLTRILAMIAIAPILSHTAIPNRVRLGLGIVITLMLIPTLPPFPAFDVFSFKGLMILVQQILIGLSIGFSMRLVFAAVELAGHLIGMTMGLGFATFFDPQSKGQTTAISQFLVILALLVFLSIDGHLIFITVVVQSFTTMPIGMEVNIDPMKVAMWGEMVFSSGLLLALPALTTLLITNMALGILTKTAPQLNLFGIGFPITICIGLLILTISLTTMVKPIENMIETGTSRMLQIIQ